MFTGIIEETGRIETIRTTGDGGSMRIGCARVLSGTREGESVAVDGTCLTVTALGDTSFQVDMAPETLNRTNLGSLKAGDQVNLERSLSPGSRMGGHFVQGHVDATGTIEEVRSDGDSIRIRIGLSESLMRYVAAKGFVAVDGISLTVIDVFDQAFTVMLVPFTRTHVTLPSKRVGDLVNIEVDILAKYVERALVARAQSEGRDASDDSAITIDYLREHGYAG